MGKRLTEHLSHQSRHTLMQALIQNLSALTTIILAQRFDTEQEEWKVIVSEIIKLS